MGGQTEWLGVFGRQDETIVPRPCKVFTMHKRKVVEIERFDAHAYAAKPTHGIGYNFVSLFGYICSHLAGGKIAIYRAPKEIPYWKRLCTKEK